MAIRRVDAAQSYNPVRKAGKTAAKLTTAAAATGAVLYMAKTGKLNPKEGGNKVLEGLKAGLKKPADFILNKGAKLKDNAKNNPKISTITDKISGFGEKAADFAEGIVNKAKFNPDKAKASEKAAETFNNFVK